MKSNARCLVADVAWAMKMSVEQFNEFSKEEKEQLIATYNSQNNRAFVMSEYPVRRRPRDQ